MKHPKTFAWSALFCAFVALPAMRAEAEPKNGRPARIYLPGEIKPLEKPIKIGAPSEVGFLRDTIYYARNAQINGGVPREAAVFATVSIVSLEPSKYISVDGGQSARTWYAQGRLKPSPNNEDAIEGKLNLWTNAAVKADSSENPFLNNNMTLNVKIRQNGRTSLHFQIDGRNRLGKGPDEFQPDTDEEMMLSTTRDFSGQKSLIRISLSRGEVLKNAPVAQPIETKKPIGAKYVVSAKFVVTNSDDGAGDNTVEARGSFNINAWNYPKPTPGAGFLNIYGSFESGAVIAMPETMTIERIFSDPKTNRLKIDGKVYDYDAATSNDTLWDAPNVLLLDNIVKQGGTRTLNGDKNDESGDLVITVKKIADIY